MQACATVVCTCMTCSIACDSMLCGGGRDVLSASGCVRDGPVHDVTISGTSNQTHSSLTPVPLIPHLIKRLTPTALSPLLLCTRPIHHCLSSTSAYSKLAVDHTAAIVRNIHVALPTRSHARTSTICWSLSRHRTKPSHNSSYALSLNIHVPKYSSRARSAAHMLSRSRTRRHAHPDGRRPSIDQADRSSWCCVRINRGRCEADKVKVSVPTQLL
jgi:hypothetical protein